MASRQSLAAAVLVAALAAAAHAGVEDRRWCRVAADHFELVTDLSREKSIELLLSLDRFRSAAYALLPGRPLEPPATPRLLVFKRAQDFSSLFEFPSHIVGFAQPSLAQSLLAFGPDRSGRHLDTFAYHEYTHFLLRSRTMLNLPIWYEEGLATYLANLHIDAAGQVTLGRGPHALLRFLLKQPQTPVEDVLNERLRMDWQRHDLSSVYALAWGVVRFLHHAKRPDGSRYAEDVGAMLQAIDRGATTAEAMRQHVGIDSDDLRPRMRGYFDAQDDLAASVFRFTMDGYAPPTVQRTCLDRAEKRLALADATAPHRPAKSAALYDSILERRPRHVGALLGRSRTAEDLAQARAFAERALAAAPDDPDVHVRLAQIGLERCQSEAAPCVESLGEAAAHYHRALDAEAHRADAAYGLGVLYLVAGHPADALDPLLAAYSRAPWSPRISFHLGQAYRFAGQVARARQHLEKTLFWHPDATWRERARRALDQLAVKATGLEPADDAEASAVVSGEPALSE